jgi:hypothetical protein
MNKVHGSYIGDYQKMGALKDGRISFEDAERRVNSSPFTEGAKYSIDETERPAPSRFGHFGEAPSLFMNKCFVVTAILGEAEGSTIRAGSLVEIVYLHDGLYYLYTAPVEILREFDIKAVIE